MNQLFLVCFFLFFQQVVFALSLPERVKLSTKIWPPYQYYNDKGELTGDSVNLLACSFARLGIELEIEVVPWTRAQHHTKYGLSDGFFSASWNKSRDEYATRSINIGAQNWVWYTLKSNKIDPQSAQFKQQAKIAATRGSNISTWLHHNNYRVTAETLDVDSMIKMLLYGRVDAVMANELVASRSAFNEAEMLKLNKTHGRSMPVSVYFNNAFLNQYKSFLSEINQAIKYCIMI